MPQFGGKDSKRHFTVVIDRGGKGGTLVPPPVVAVHRN